ncbi:hypothetical protein Bca4012_051154 [Brassica carinata]|nr:unnamed protein product [Brassica oleracea]
MVELRLLRFWKARKIKRGGHLMVVGMLILDSKARSCPQHRCEPSSHLPVTLEGADMVGKTYTLQVRISSYNFTANHQTFTISRILNEPDRLPLHDFVTQDGFDDNDADMPGSVSVPTKVDINDADYEEVPTAVTTSTGVNNSKSLTAGTSKASKDCVA